jgi:hypothetical protein
MEEQAREVAVRLVRALIAADADALQELFEPSVLYAGRHRNVPRATVARQCLEAAAQLGWQTGARVDDILVSDSIVVRKAGQTPAGQSPPEGIRSTDLQVDIRLRTDGSQPHHLCFRLRSGTTRIYVRPGLAPRIVSFFP